MNGLDLQIARIPVRIRPEFFLGAVLLGLGSYTSPLLLAWWIFAVGLFVLLHELGHAIMFRRYGHSPSIQLLMFGGVTSGTPGRMLSPRQDLVVSLAGPMMGLLVGGTVWVLRDYFGHPESMLMRRVVADILWINIGWSILNLLPILPLDGGRSFAAVMRHFFGEWSGRKIAYVVSMVCAALLAVYAYSIGQIFMAMFAAMYAFSNFNAMRAGQ